MDLENLDLEEIDQEMVVDKASQSTTATLAGDAPRDAPVPPFVGDDKATT